MNSIAKDFFDKHRQALESAQEACRERGYFSVFAETPDRHPGGERAAAEGQRRFQEQLGRAFELDQAGTMGRAGAEVSPYTGEPLQIDYPQANPDALFDAARSAMSSWADASPEHRLGVCMEMITRLHDEIFLTAETVMHTAGQSRLMSYAGSGTNALDRGVEALVYAAKAMADVPTSVLWERRFGSTRIRLQKNYRLVPRGVAVCFACATFPTWNAYPAIMASLSTGNPVIVKPHPTGILPMAIAVRVCREVLQESGFSPDLVSLCIDSTDKPLGKLLIKDSRTAIVDFTGSARFGAWVETNAAPARCFSETSGVNTVVIDSVTEIEPVIKSLATTMSLFSAQMCTSPQNIYLPTDGIRVAGGGRVAPEDFASALAAAMRHISADPRRAAGILAAIQSPSTLDLVDELTATGRAQGDVALESTSYEHPEYPRARTRSPLLLTVTPKARALYAEERFGPIGFAIRCADADAALMEAAADAQEGGAITAFVYSTDERFLGRATQAFSRSGAQLTCNLTGPMPLNFAAAYSDYHVTGLNPAGNATLTDLSFVASRFHVTQARTMLPD